MLSAADALDAGSLHPTDSPALHSRFLRRLVRNTQRNNSVSAASMQEQPPPPGSANSVTSGLMPSHQQPPSSAGGFATTPLNGLSEVASSMRPVPPQMPMAPGVFPGIPGMPPMPGAFRGGPGAMPYPVDWAAPGTDGSLWSQMDGAWWDRESDGRSRWLAEALELTKLLPC